MNWLTKQEQFILALVMGLFLLGLAVKAYRTATTVPPVPTQSSENSVNR